MYFSKVDYSRYISSLLIIIIFNILFGVDNYIKSNSFPPRGITPTFENANKLNLIYQFNEENNSNDLDLILSEYKNLNTTRDEFDWDNAAHLLRRTTIGPTFEEINQAVSLGLEGTLDLLFDQKPQPEPPGDWVYHPISPDFNQLTTTQKDSIRDGWKDQFVTMSGWWLNLMYDSGLNIRETMTLFWHDHFATSGEVVKFLPSMYIQNQMLRKFATGNFKNLVKSINYDPAMLQWLDNDQNYFVSEENQTINENYARELLELFSMGEGNYSQFDIEEAARALTGFSTDGINTFYSPTRHDPGNKQFIDQVGNFDADEIVEIVFQQQEPSIFICTKLYKWFVYAIPDESIINEMALLLVENDYQIEPVLRSLLSSDHFFDENFRGAKYKNPVLFTLGTFRQLYSIDDLDHEFMLWYQLTLGEQLFFPPDVSGWDGYRSWINTYTLPYRKLFTNQVLDGYDDFFQPWDGAISFAERFSNPYNPEILLQEFGDYFYSVLPSDQTMDLLLEELLDGSEIYDWDLYAMGSEQRLKDVIKHMMRLEEFQLR